MSKIFVSYRRADSPGHAGRIWDHIIERFGKDAVFRDIDKIEYGVDFVEAIQSAVENCKVLIVVIGPSWLDIKDDSGNRRLENPEDFIRLEVATALARRVRVIPVLVEGARMPAAEELPQDMKGLARRQALEVTEKRFENEMEDLFKAIEGVTEGVMPNSAAAPPPAVTPPRPGAGPEPSRTEQARSESRAHVQPQNPPGGVVPNYLVWSIISTACLCMPLGIVGIIQSNKAAAAHAAGDFAAAQAAAAAAKKWNFIALGVGGVSWLLYLIIAALKGASQY